MLQNLFESIGWNVPCFLIPMSDQTSKQSESSSSNTCKQHTKKQQLLLALSDHFFLPNDQPQPIPHTTHRFFPASHSQTCSLHPPPFPNANTTKSPLHPPSALHKYPVCSPWTLLTVSSYRSNQFTHMSTHWTTWLFIQAARFDTY